MSFSFEGPVEKKAFMGYTRKWFYLRGNKVAFADVDKGEVKGQIIVNAVSRTAEVGGETYGIILQSSSGDTWNFRALDRESFFQWYNAIYTALEQLSLVPPRNNGLPPADPRTGLPFIEIPPEYLHRFSFLDAAVLHWFSPVKKVGAKSSISSKTAIEERILVLSDKYLYICKPCGDITRCMKIVDIEKIWCNYRRVEPGKEITVGLKLKAPDYDVVLSSLETVAFLKAFCCAYKYLTKGLDCPIAEANFEGILNECKLVRPENWEFVLVLPTSKAQLRKAFDVFSQKTGVKLLPDNPLQKTASQSRLTGGVQPAMGASGPAAQPVAHVESTDIVPRTDPMGYFLIKLNMEKYYSGLKNQKVDLDVLEYMDESDLQHFGISEAAHRKRILEAFTKQSFLDEMHEEIAQHRAREGKDDEIDAPPRKTISEVKPKPVISLDDDDDDLGLVPPPKPAAKPAVSLDDDDDDLGLAPPPKPAAKPAVSLDDDDDDLGLAPPPKPAAKPAIAFDDDDF